MNKETQQPLKTTPGISLPLVNEIAAVHLGICLANPESKAKVENEILKKFEKIDVVCKQNTADTVNIVVPDFDCIEELSTVLSESDLEQVSGGEGIIAAIVAFVGSIGAALGVGSGVTLIVSGGTVIATSVAVSSFVAGAGMLALSTAIGVSVGTTIGLGIAHGLGALGSAGSGSDVSIGHAS
ncbi:MAG: hypothetical protein OXU34_04875 [Gammaproteobacteria bacterium]|nr:hypothetical protein [Gammaproteobacteria bacterium]